ncbi:MAG TPA: nitroreductase/quinone reductase family protein [Solirubrobacterales bacterium]|nr:nitroreductase/quinone reductase family protein [Solirubrobacterales bacterium]
MSLGDFVNRWFAKSHRLRKVDPRPRGRLYNAWARLSATRLGLWLSRTFAWRLDPYLLRVTGGRLGSGLLLPTALLETTGARSGEPRRNGVIYFHDGDRPVIVASLAGAPRHPAWFFNARANPEVKLNGRTYRAEVVGDEAERSRLWALADSVFPPFESYRRSAAAAGRTIPILRLSATR